MVDPVGVLRTALLAAVLALPYLLAPSFSGLALVCVLLTAAVIAPLVLVAPYPVAGAAPGQLRAWLAWAAGLAAAQAVVLPARDDLRWPTFSALQDPLTSQWPPGRFAAGLVWAAAGLGLVRIARRSPGPITPLGRGSAAAVFLGLASLTAVALPGGPMLQPREAPAPASGIETVPPSDWPATAWMSIVWFCGLAAAAVALHLRGRRTEPPGGAGDLLAWLMAPWTGRLLGLAVWVWCGWHFLAR